MVAIVFITVCLDDGPRPELFVSVKDRTSWRISSYLGDTLFNIVGKSNIPFYMDIRSGAILDAQRLREVSCIIVDRHAAAADFAW